MPISGVENVCISRRDRHTSSFGRKILLFEEISSLNLPIEKGGTHDVIKQPTKVMGRAGKQPITAQFTKKASLDVSVTNLEQNLQSPDWTAGEIFGTSSKSEEGNYSAD